MLFVTPKKIKQNIYIKMDKYQLFGIIILLIFGCGCFCAIDRFKQKESFNTQSKTMAPLNPKDNQTTPLADEVLHRDPVEDTFAVEHNYKIERDKRGWWTDVINCQNTGNTSIYCKPKSLWIWPY